MILTVGLTGGIASGKSTAARILASLGCITVDADAVVADLYLPGHAGHGALVRAYGREILNADGTIDRPRVAAIAFASAEATKRLNALIHPLVIEEERRIIAAAEKPGLDQIVVNEATLLLEAGGKGRYDRIVVVDAPPEVQIARAVARGMAREDAVRRMAQQMPREERRRYADYVIDNSGDEERLRGETVRVFESLQRELRQKAKGKRQKS